MGSKASKKKDLVPKSAASSAPVEDTDEYWWKVTAETLAPIKNCDEFCKRFNATSKDYNALVKKFHDRIAAGPGDDRDKSYMSFETWIAGFPPGLNVKWFATRIWQAFDMDKNDMLTLDEWLVYAGVREFGTPEQHVLASFVVFDEDDDYKLTHDELVKMYGAASELEKEHVGQEELTVKAEEIMASADLDKNGTLELCEAIKASRIHEGARKIFHCI